MDNKHAVAAPRSSKAWKQARPPQNKRRRALTALAAVVIVAGGGWGL